MALTLEDTGTAARELERLSHIPRKVGPEVQARINALGIGQKMQDLPEELWHDSFRYYVKDDPNRRGGPNLRLIRLDPRATSLTVTAYIYNKFVHPWEDRYITPREAARLQDFPDTFVFEGTLTSVQKQIGNAVPVRLSAAVAEAILLHARMHGALDGYLTTEEVAIPALSLFSGAGGLDLGFGPEMLRAPGPFFRSVAHVELDADCCRTLSANFGVDVRPLDIGAIQAPRNFLLERSGMDFVPLVLGGPPCQAFSQAGRQKADDDDRGKLIFEFLRFVDELRPTYFAMENVANLKGVAGGRLFASVQRHMRGLGYNVSPMKLCAAHYGTPQRRWRWFFVGVRDAYPPVMEPNRTHRDPGEPLPLAEQLPPFRTVEDAFRGLPPLLPRRP